MQRTDAGGLLDLRPTAEAVGDDDRVGTGGPHCREQHPLRAGHGHVVVAAFESEVAGQPAATRVEDVDIVRHLPEELLVGTESHDGALMAVGLHQHPAAPARCDAAPSRAGEHLCQRARLAAETLGVLVVREQLDEVGPEHRSAAGLESDDRHPRSYDWSKGLQGAGEDPFGESQLTGRDPREPTTKTPLRNAHREPGVFEHGDGGDGDLRMKVVVEGVGPQQHRWSVVWIRAGRAMANEPVRERLRREAGDLPLGVDAPE